MDLVRGQLFIQSIIFLKFLGVEVRISIMVDNMRLPAATFAPTGNVACQRAKTVDILVTSDFGICGTHGILTGHNSQNSGSSAFVEYCLGPEWDVTRT